MNNEQLPIANLYKEAPHENIPFPDLGAGIILDAGPYVGKRRVKTHKNSRAL